MHKPLYLACPHNLDLSSFKGLVNLGVCSASNDHTDHSMSHVFNSAQLSIIYAMNQVGSQIAVRITQSNMSSLRCKCGAGLMVCRTTLNAADQQPADASYA